MSLVEIARFAGLPEAQIAASRLRANGFPVLIQNEHWGANDFTMVIAMGGFRLWTPTSEAEEARDLIARLRAATQPVGDEAPPSPEEPYAIRLQQALRTVAALFLFWIFSAPMALLLVRLRHGGGPWAGAVRIVARTIAFSAVAYGLFWLAVWLQLQIVTPPTSS